MHEDKRDRFRWDVFLSYSSKDKDAVREIAERLRADGLRVWFDDWEIGVGETIGHKIEEGLEHSRLMVFCMTENAFGSDWAELETQTALFADPLNKKQRFVPVRLDSVEPKGSHRIRKYLDWNDGAEYQQLLEICGGVREKPEEETPNDKQRRFKEKLRSGAIGLGASGWHVNSVAFSPDGKLALSGDNSSVVRLWEIDSGQCLRVFEGHSDAVTSVAFSTDGKRALSGAYDSSVRLWEIDSGQCLRVFEGHSDAVNSVAFSTDGKRALSGASDSSVRLWEIDSGQCLRVFEGHSDAVNSVAFSTDGKRALSGASDSSVRLWEIESGQCLRVFEGHSDWVRSVAFSTDGKRALSGASDSSVRLWEIDSGQCLRVFEGHSGSVNSVAFSTDGKWALSGADDSSVRLWEIDSGQCLRVFEGHSGSVNSVAFSPDGKRALSGAYDSSVRLWEIDSGQCLRVFEGHSGSVNSVAFSTDGKRALSGADDSSVRLWEIDSGQCLRVFEGHSNPVTSVAFSPDGKRALSGAGDSSVRLWEIDSAQCLRIFEGHSDWVRSVAFSTDGKRALSGADDSSVRLWEIDSGQCLRVFEGHSDWVRSVAFSTDGKRALSGADDSSVRLWEIDSGQCLRVFEGHSNPVTSVAFSPDGKRALSGAYDSSVRLWEIDSGQCLRVFEGHSGSVRSVAFSSDGKRALSGASDSSVRLWEIESGQCLNVLKAPLSVLSIAFDGDHVLSGHNSLIKIWSLSHIDELEPALPTRGRQYTNAKVLIVGNSGAGKTGLTERLAKDSFTPTHSTSGAWSTRWKLEVENEDDSVEQEVWLWDFGGQADQRLIHQLYMENAALILLLFNADQPDPLPGLREWRQSLERCFEESPPAFLVAARTDAGFKAGRARVQEFAEDHKYQYFETSAVEGGLPCDKLRNAMLETIPWGKLTKYTTLDTYKRLKDAIVDLRDEGFVVMHYKQLLAELQSRGVVEKGFTSKELETVIRLLDGPGVLKELDFGAWILLKPEWINAYAQAVIRTLRTADPEVGSLPIRAILDGDLVFTSMDEEGKKRKEARLESEDEKIVLQAMEESLVNRSLCLRHESRLVFPSHCGRERDAKPISKPMTTLVSYEVSGFLDDIYATLVVRLAYCEAFQLKKLWRDAVDLSTLNGKASASVKLDRQDEANGTIELSFGERMAMSEQVTFANFVQPHLKKKASKVQRLRHYACPKCGTELGNSEKAMELLLRDGKKRKVTCMDCETKYPLWDDIEDLFASQEIKAKVDKMEKRGIEIKDSRRKGQLLVNEVDSRFLHADQKSMEIPGHLDEGIDMQVEWTDDEGKGTGQLIFLQLKAGNSHLYKRKDGVETFQLKKKWVTNWLKQPGPVYLVVGTFPEEDERDHRGSSAENRFASVRWMEVKEVLRKRTDNGKKTVKMLEFEGEELDQRAILTCRRRILEA